MILIDHLNGLLLTLDLLAILFTLYTLFVDSVLPF